MSKQVNNNSDFLVRVDKGWKKILSQLKTDEEATFKGLVEDALSTTYMIGKNGKPLRVNK